MKGVKPRGLTDHEAMVQSPIDYGRGRVCLSEECSVLVSRYNPLPFCCLHEDEWYDEPCEYNEYGERQCKLCGKWWTPGSVCWTRDERMRDGLSPVCRSCRRHSKYRDRKRAEGR